MAVRTERRQYWSWRGRKQGPNSKFTWMHHFEEEKQYPQIKVEKLLRSHAFLLRILQHELSPPNDHKSFTRLKCFLWQLTPELIPPPIHNKAQTSCTTMFSTIHLVLWCYRYRQSVFSISILFRCIFSNSVLLECITSRNQYIIQVFQYQYYTWV